MWVYNILRNLSKFQRNKKGETYTAMSRVHSDNNAVSVVSAASVVGVGGDVGSVGDGGEGIHVYGD